MRFNKNKLYKEFNQQDLDMGTAPVVYTGMENQKTILVFDDIFETKSITRLINDIESVRQIGGYSVIDLYFTSDGGSADSMFMLSDYLNNLEDIHINLIVTGMVASAGFYILLLINNPCVNIEFNKCCSGLIHLGDTYVSCRGQLASENSRYNYDKFVSDHLDKLNDFFKKEILPKLNLSKKDLKHINEGKDLMLCADELEKMINEYHDKIFFESDEAVEQYIMLNEKIEQYAIALDKMREGFSKYADRDIDKELGIDYSFYQEEEDVPCV